MTAKSPDRGRSDGSRRTPSRQQVKTPQEAAASADPNGEARRRPRVGRPARPQASDPLLRACRRCRSGSGRGHRRRCYRAWTPGRLRNEGPLEELRDQVDHATKSASSAAQDDVADLHDRLDELESRKIGSSQVNHVGSRDLGRPRRHRRHARPDRSARVRRAGCARRRRKRRLGLKRQQQRLVTIHTFVRGNRPTGTFYFRQVRISRKERRHA